MPYRELTKDSTIVCFRRAHVVNERMSDSNPYCFQFRLPNLCPINKKRPPRIIRRSQFFYCIVANDVLRIQLYTQATSISNLSTARLEGRLTSTILSKIESPAPRGSCDDAWSRSPRSETHIFPEQRACMYGTTSCR